MSLRSDRERYERAYANRSSQTFAVEPNSVTEQMRDWAQHVLIIATSPEHGPQIADLFDEIHLRDSLLPFKGPGEPTECLAGLYKGARVSVWHVGITPGAHGPSYVDMTLETLRDGPARTAVVIGEMSSLQPEVHIGDLVVATSAIRGDDSHRSYALADVPAVADLGVSRELLAAARAARRRVHVGAGWSCGAGAGIYDPCLTDRALNLCRLGVLGDTLEAATAYLLGQILGLRVGSLWLVADSVFEAITWRRPSPRLEWEEGWDVLARSGLDALAALAQGAEQ